MCTRCQGLDGQDHGCMGASGGACLSDWHAEHDFTGSQCLNLDSANPTECNSASSNPGGMDHHLPQLLRTGWSVADHSVPWHSAVPGQGCVPWCRCSKSGTEDFCNVTSGNKSFLWTSEMIDKDSPLSISIHNFVFLCFRLLSTNPFVCRRPWRRTLATSCLVGFPPWL